MGVGPRLFCKLFSSQLRRWLLARRRPLQGKQVVQEEAEEAHRGGREPQLSPTVYTVMCRASTPILNPNLRDA